MGALTGPAEEKSALIDPDAFDHPDGVARLIARFEDHCKEELVVRQSVAINNYEALVRAAGQSMTKYITEWRQAEIKLRDALIPAYPAEVRAARLLEGAKIGEQSRQIIMTTAGNTYDPEKIATALQRHFPPYVPGRVIKKSSLSERAPPPFVRSAGRGKWQLLADVRYGRCGRL